MNDAAPGTLDLAPHTGPPASGIVSTAGAGPLAAAMLARLDAEHPVLAKRTDLDRLLAAT